MLCAFCCLKWNLHWITRSYYYVLLWVCKNVEFLFSEINQECNPLSETYRKHECLTSWSRSFSILVNLERVVPVMVLTSASLPVTPKTSLEDWSSDESWLQGFSNWLNQSFWSSWTVKWRVSLVVVETVGLPFATWLCMISSSAKKIILSNPIWLEK